MTWHQKNELVHYVAGIDKLTEASQVSEDGSTLLLQNSDSPLSQSDRSSETRVRDAEAASEDDKVRYHLMTSGISYLSIYINKICSFLII